MKVKSKLQLSPDEKKLGKVDTKQGKKILGENIAKNINKIKVGDLVKVKKYGWIMRVDDIKGNLFYLENSKKGFDLSGKSGNAGSYYINEIQKIDNITGTKRKQTKSHHKDIKSHNVNIRVISGFKKFVKHKGFTIDLIELTNGKKEYAVYQISPITKKEVYYGSYLSLSAAKNFINRSLYLFKKLSNG